MSSRVLRAAAAAGVIPVVWRGTGGNRSTSPVAQNASHGPSGQGADAPGEGSGDESQERAAQARIDAARQQGRTEGEAAGFARAALRLDPVIAHLSAVIQELAGQRARVRAEAEEDTVQLAIAIARRVLYRELATDPEAILGLVMAAFQKLNARETHRLRVSPGDAAAMEENRARLQLPPRVEIAGDPSLAPGSAVFETSRGELDASIDTQMAEIGRGLADIMKRRAR
jgi:flagellar assembly protein FliH